MDNNVPGLLSALGWTDTPLCAESGPIVAPLRPEPESALLSPYPEKSQHKIKIGLLSTFSK